MWGRKLIKLSLIPCTMLLVAGCAHKEDCVKDYSFSTVISSSTGDVEACTQLCEATDGCSVSSDGGSSQITYSKTLDSCDGAADEASKRDLLAQACQTSSGVK